MREASRAPSRSLRLNAQPRPLVHARTPRRKRLTKERCETAARKTAACPSVMAARSLCNALACPLFRFGCGVESQMVLPSGAHAPIELQCAGRSATHLVAKHCAGTTRDRDTPVGGIGCEAAAVLYLYAVLESTTRRRPEGYQVSPRRRDRKPAVAGIGANASAVVAHPGLNLGGGGHQLQRIFSAMNRYQRWP